MIQIRTDHSGGPPDELPPTPEPTLCLYHWSPSVNRKRIEKLGLVPGRWSHDKQWRPPYICFSNDPSMAWHLSGRLYPEIAQWDLWMVYNPMDLPLKKIHIITDMYRSTGRAYIKEYRIYERIYKRNLTYIGSRMG